MRPIELVLSRLSHLTKSGNGWKAKCPAHDDQNPSLSVWENDDSSAGVKCYAGCERDAVLSTVGLTWKDLRPVAGPLKISNGRAATAAKPNKTRKRSARTFPTADAAAAEIRRSHGLGDPAASWPYHDANGNEVARVYRWNMPDGKKKIRPVCCDADGWRIGSLDAPRPLYRLPELLEARRVFVCEGEKAADALRFIGLAATTSPHGADAADKADWSPLTGREVVILPDNDAPGRKYAEAVRCCLSVLQPAPVVKLLELEGLPEKGDAFDWVEQRDATEPEALRQQFASLVDIAPEFSNDERLSTGRNRQPSPAEERKGESRGATATRITDPEQQTDLANARRFKKRFGDDWRFVATWKRRFGWDGRRWCEDAGNVRSLALMHDIADEVWQRIDRHDDNAVRFGQRAASAAGMRAALAVSDSMLAIDYSVLDSDSWLFNCPNGTVDLRAGELRPHRRGDFLTKLCPTEYHPGAACPRWLQFLTEVFGSQELAEYVQRVAGYCLTGDVSEQALWILHGSGANGKSTFLTMLQETFGPDYASQAPPSLLTVKRGESHPTELAALHGKRLVVATETDSGARLAESQVKQLTGGDVISARRMREDFWSFSPTHKLLMCTNHRPRVRGTDHAIWRRLQLVPFTQTFGDDRKDPRLPERLRSEAAGILAWAVRGCLEWQKQGLNPPSEVRLATEEYRNSEDIIGQFVSTECVTDRDACRVRFSELHAALERFFNDGGDHPPSKRAFGKWLRDAGFKEYSNNGRWYVGIGLRVPAE